RAAVRIGRANPERNVVEVQLVSSSLQPHPQTSAILGVRPQAVWPGILHRPRWRNANQTAGTESDARPKDFCSPDSFPVLLGLRPAQHAASLMPVRASGHAPRPLA